MDYLGRSKGRLQSVGYVRYQEGNGSTVRMRLDMIMNRRRLTGLQGAHSISQRTNVCPMGRRRFTGNNIIVLLSRYNIIHVVKAPDPSLG